MSVSEVFLLLLSAFETGGESLTTSNFIKRITKKIDKTTTAAISITMSIVSMNFFRNLKNAMDS